MKRRHLFASVLFTALILSFSNARAFVADTLALEEGAASTATPIPTGPSSYVHQLGDAVTLDLNAYGLPQTYSFGVQLTWDPNVLSLDFNNPTFLANNWLPGWQFNPATAAAGTIKLDGFTLFNPVSGNANMGALHFNAIGTGTTTVQLSYLTGGTGFTDTSGVDITFTNVYGADVTVQAVPLPGALMLFASALGGLGVFGRLRKA